MEVATDVVNLNDVMLLAKGTLLTASHLRALKMWGIETIQVVGEDSEKSSDAPTVPKEVLEAAQKLVQRRFKHVSENAPCVAAVKQIAIQRTANHLLAQASQPPTAIP